MRFDEVEGCISITIMGDHLELYFAKIFHYLIRSLLSWLIGTFIKVFSRYERILSTHRLRRNY